MKIVRSKEHRIYQKHFWIKKRLVRFHQTSLSKYPSKDASSILRDMHCWYFRIGTIPYFIFKSNKWDSKFEDKPRYGKKKRSHYVDNRDYGKTSSRILDKKEFNQLLKYYGLM